MNATSRTQPRVRFATFFLLLATLCSQALANENVYDKAIQSTAFIYCAAQDGSACGGSGVLIDRERRLLVTNHHVVENAEKVIVFFPITQQGQINSDQAYYMNHAAEIGIEATVVAEDKQRDIALLQLATVPDHISAIEIGGSARPGQVVHSIGNPGSSDAMWIYTNGYVRANYYKRFSDCRMQVVETSSPINQGDSGGPMLNDAGQLIGISQSYLTTGRLVSNGVDVSEIVWFVNKTLGQPGNTTALIPSSNTNASARTSPSAKLMNLLGSTKSGNRIKK